MHTRLPLSHDNKARRLGLAALWHHRMLFTQFCRGRFHSLECLCLGVMYLTARGGMHLTAPAHTLHAATCNLGRISLCQQIPIKPIEAHMHAHTHAQHYTLSCAPLACPCSALDRHGLVGPLIERCQDTDKSTRKFACFAIGNAGGLCVCSRLEHAFEVCLAHTEARMGLVPHLLCMCFAKAKKRRQRTERSRLLP